MSHYTQLLTFIVTSMREYEEKLKDVESIIKPQV